MLFQTMQGGFYSFMHWIVVVHTDMPATLVSGNSHATSSPNNE